MGNYGTQEWFWQYRTLKRLIITVNFCFEFCILKCPGKALFGSFEILLGGHGPADLPWLRPCLNFIQNKKNILIVSKLLFNL